MTPANTAKGMLPAIGARVLVSFEDIQVSCTVENVKNTFGRMRLLVKPLQGKGSQWIETPRVTAILDPAKGELSHGS